MSYFVISEEQMTTPEPVKKVRDHRGANNPHYGHIMKPASKDAISRSQKARYDYYRKAIENMLTEERVRDIIKETIDDYMANNATEIKNNKPNNIPL
jgi:hypothetical protein